MFDMMTMVGIDMIACRMAIEIDDTVPPITLFTDELISGAIVEYFGDDEMWRAEMLPIALKEYRDAQAAQQAVESFGQAMIGRIMGRWGGRF